MLSRLAWTAVGVAALILTTPAAYAASPETAAVRSPTHVYHRVAAIRDGDAICFSVRPLPYVDRKYADEVTVVQREVRFRCVPQDGEPPYYRVFTIGLPVIS
ncbi:hypothetical protein ACFY4B_18815 [Kitasatospora sp. NPDC001261]|uniref:hypothetical protein n=1 Tax=Kitasatospora sp. NPDC001261 TaxID=3364012 RepID=UPI00369591ED